VSFTLKIAPHAFPVGPICTPIFIICSNRSKVCMVSMGSFHNVFVRMVEWAEENHNRTRETEVWLMRGSECQKPLS